jgi:uncharacterized membrane-anchored protein YitT (DUF2179 family)
MNKKNKSQKRVLNFILILLGTFILAVSVEFFILPYKILSGGVAGIAVAVEPFFHIDETLLANILTILMLAVGRIFLGRSFTMKTIISSLAYPVFTTFLAHFPQPINVHPMLASFYAGLLGGIGIGLVMRAGATTGGMDIPPMIINKLFGVKISTGIMVTDAITVLLGIAAYGINAVLIGLISVFTTAIGIDKVLSIGEGMDAKSVQIISEHWEEIVTVIDDELKRDVTLLPAKGGYQQADKMVILCVVSGSQYTELLEIIKKIDARAFTITTDATDMHGEGFTWASPHI